MTSLMGRNWRTSIFPLKITVMTSEQVYAKGRGRVLKNLMKHANRIDHEKVSIDSFVQHLNQRCGGLNIQVRQEEDDPPDFWLSIDRSTFAVEETSIADEATIRGRAGTRKQRRSLDITSKWEGEMQDELVGLIQNSVSRKRLRLEKKGVPQQCRNIILLLYDAYGYAEADDAKVALRGVHGYDWFHSVFWARSFADRTNELYPEEPGRVGLFLYTKENSWKE